MAQLWYDEQVTAAADFASLFADDGPFGGPDERWFRGEGKLRGSRVLLPSLFRDAALSPDREWKEYQRFRQAGSAFLPHSNLNDWDWMLYMRHYGAPTRLLDWSESPLVALYFAVEREQRDSEEGVVWVLDPLRLNEGAGFDRRLYCAGIDDELNVYTAKAVKDAIAGVRYQPVAVIAPRSFPRLVAQQGVFTITHKEPAALEELAIDRLLARIRIPAVAKKGIRTSLQKLGIGRLSMYPELQSLGEKR